MSEFEEEEGDAFPDSASANTLRRVGAFNLLNPERWMAALGWAAISVNGERDCEQHGRRKRGMLIEIQISRKKSSISKQISIVNTSSMSLNFRISFPDAMTSELYQYCVCDYRING